MQPRKTGQRRLFLATLSFDFHWVVQTLHWKTNSLGTLGMHVYTGTSHATSDFHSSFPWEEEAGVTRTACLQLGAMW